MRTHSIYPGATFLALIILLITGCSKPILFAEIQPDMVPDTNVTLDEAVLYRVKTICLTSNLGANERVSSRYGLCDCMNDYYSGWTNLQFKQFYFEIIPKVLRKEDLTAAETQKYGVWKRKQDQCKLVPSTSAKSKELPKPQKENSSSRVPSQPDPAQSLSSSQSDQVEKRLSKLKGLLNKGLLTEEEAAEKRKEILEGL